MDTSRREFLIGCSAAIAAYGSRSLVHAGVAPIRTDGPSDVLVVVFLRGGMDGLHLLAPVDDRDYIEARPINLRIPDAGDQAGLELAGGPDGHDFRLHKSAAAIKELYDGKQLAFIHACGLTNGTRSHFEAMDLVERGVSDTSQQKLSSGWLTRHLQSLSGDDSVLLPAFSGEDSLPTSLLGYSRAAAARESTRFGLWWGNAQREALDKLYTEGTPLYERARATLSVLKAVHEKLPKRGNGEVEPYKPRRDAKYPGGPLSQSLQTVAQMIKLDLGVRVATVDYGGWDTHQNQSYLFPVRTRELSESLAAFYRDVSDHHERLTVIVHSEFGRRLKANKSDGTDHGHGAVMMVMGGSVAGGRIHGRWPGLATEQLDSRADLAVTTDIRQVLGEVILKRQGNPKLGTVFPGLKSYAPLGIVQGTELPVEL